MDVCDAKLSSSQLKKSIPFAARAASSSDRLPAIRALFEFQHTGLRPEQRLRTSILPAHSRPRKANR